MINLKAMVNPEISGRQQIALAHFGHGIYGRNCQHSCDTIVIGDRGTPRGVHAVQISVDDRIRRAEDIQVLVKD